MNLNNKLNSIDFKDKKVYIPIIILVLMIILILCFVFLKKPEEAPIVDSVKNTPEITVEDEPLIEDIEEVPQDTTVSIFKAYINHIRDLSVRIEYDIKVGVGDSAVDSVVVANGNTVFYNLDTQKIVVPNNIVEGSNVVLYATGNYNAGNLIANVICLGEDTSYRYGELNNIENQENYYLWNINNTSDRLYVNSDCKVIDGYTGSEILNKGIIEPNSKILYKYEPEYDITDKGNIYHCNEVIILGTTE